MLPNDPHGLRPVILPDDSAHSYDRIWYRLAESSKLEALLQEFTKRNNIDGFFRLTLVTTNASTEKEANEILRPANRLLGLQKGGYLLIVGIDGQQEFSVPVGQLAHSRGQCGILISPAKYSLRDSICFVFLSPFEKGNSGISSFNNAAFGAIASVYEGPIAIHRLVDCFFDAQTGQFWNSDFEMRQVGRLDAFMSPSLTEEMDERHIERYRLALSLIGHSLRRSADDGVRVLLHCTALEVISSGNMQNYFRRVGKYFECDQHNRIAKQFSQYRHDFVHKAIYPPRNIGDLIRLVRFLILDGIAFERGGSPKYSIVRNAMAELTNTKPD